MSLPSCNRDAAQIYTKQQNARRRPSQSSGAFAGRGPPLCNRGATKGGVEMHRSRFLLFLSVAFMAVLPSAYADEGAFVGLNVGESEPTNSNYRAHAESGVEGSPFG